MMTGKKAPIFLLALEMLFMWSLAFSQAPPKPTPPQAQTPPNKPGLPKTEPPVIKKLGENLVQINSITVNTAQKEVSVTGRAMSDRTLEFIASTKGGEKLYESALELDTDATSFNFALIMIGLDRSHGVAPKGHFGPEAGGDPVEIWIEWGSGDSSRKIPIEDLLYDTTAQRVPHMGEWVYTGSTILTDGRYRAEVEGVLIGFVHDPASLIENVTGSGINAYGTIKINPKLNLAPDTKVKLTVRSLPKQKKASQP
jgi:hypothetical protein